MRRVTIPIIILLAVLLVLLAFAFQGSRGLWQPDEGYYVGTAVTMLDKGKLLIPYLGKDIFLEKPPLTYWAVMAGLKLFGHSEFGARAFNALCYVATAATVGLLGLYLFNSTLEALIACFIYATMVLPFIAANFVTPDTPLVLWTTASALFFWKSAEPDARHPVLWKMLLCCTVGLGFLTKGPAALIPCAGMFVFLAVRRQVTKYFLTPWAILGFLLFCLIGLGWYFYMAVRVPGAASYFIDNEIWGRLVSPKYNRNPGITGALIYLPVLIFSSLPASAIWWQKTQAIKTTILERSWWTHLPDRPTALFLLTWFFVPLVILCLASSKLGLYALPIFPALALASSRLWAERLRPFLSLQSCTTTRSFIRPAALIACWPLLLLAGKLALAYYPTAKDARALWRQISSYIPQGSYEIVTIDKHADGLLFYGAKEVENVTKKSKPYPTFSMPEHVLQELKDISVDNHPFLFLVNDTDDMLEIADLLSKDAIDFQRIPLPHGRFLLLAEPPTAAVRTAPKARSPA